MQRHQVTGKIIEASTGEPVAHAAVTFKAVRRGSQTYHRTLERADAAIANVGVVDAVTTATGDVVLAKGEGPVMLAETTSAWLWQCTVHHARVNADPFRFDVDGPVVLHEVAWVNPTAPPSSGGLSLVDAGGGLWSIGGMTDMGDGTYSA